MEWKIGEIRQIKGEWYQCINPEIYGCSYCDLENKCIDDIKGKVATCHARYRSDKKCVVFKKLEKVGESFTSAGKLCQHYKVFDIDNVCGDGFWFVYNYKAKILTIEIKQNKEDMEEKKPNMKPFDLEAAKAGKPVCTRDGRKARIICFDTKGDPCPIIALVEENGIEAAYHYDKNGQNAYNKSELDLMMLHEKKSGWANIVIGSDGRPHMGRGIFQSKEAAEDAIKAFSSKLIDTIKIEWYD